MIYKTSSGPVEEKEESRERRDEIGSVFFVFSADNACTVSCLRLWEHKNVLNCVHEY